MIQGFTSQNLFWDWCKPSQQTYKQIIFIFIHTEAAIWISFLFWYASDVMLDLVDGLS